MEKELKEALMEAAQWEHQITKYEGTKLTYAKARERVVNRIFKKYKDKIIKSQ